MTLSPLNLQHTGGAFIYNEVNDKHVANLPRVSQMCGQVLPLGVEGGPAEGPGQEVHRPRQEHAHQDCGH